MVNHLRIEPEQQRTQEFLIHDAGFKKSPASAGLHDIFQDVV